MEILLLTMGFLVTFVVGVIVGLYDSSSVEAAIKTLKSAEASAQATLAKITAHKAQ